MVIHPFLVHFPVALLLTSVVFDLLGRRTGQAGLRSAGLYTLIAGVSGGCLAALAGLRDAGMVRARALERLGERAQPLLEAISTHQTLALVTLGMFAALLLWRLANRDQLSRADQAAYLTVAALASALLLYAGYLGGMLAHGQRPSAAPAGRVDAPRVEASPAAQTVVDPESGPPPEGCGGG